MRRTYMYIISDLARWACITDHCGMYLARFGGSGDLLQNTADILCQHLGALGVYAHGLFVRLVLLRHYLR
jgi:hypothetical protein